MGIRVDSVVCYKWQTEGYRSTFGPESVNVLARMVRRHYRPDVRVICVTDQPDGIDSSVEIVPDWKDFVQVRSPHGAGQPSCYRRLRSFHPDIGAAFGSRFVTVDLDCVVTGDLTPVWERDEDFVIWGDTGPKTLYNGSMVLMTAGARPQVWTDFDPLLSPSTSKSAGLWGSDQGWISYRLGKGEAMWTIADGVVSYRNHVLPSEGRLPANARIVFLHGANDPWQPHVAQRHRWLMESYV
jgi:hypothetical protein